MAKMGRPKADKPKDTFLQIRITKEESEKFNEYCKKNDTTKSKVLIKFIRSLIN